MSDAMINELVAKAKEIRENAYAPYSKYKVGASILCRDGEIFTGVNNENASYPAGICAERAALAAAITAGKREFKAIAVYASSSVMPCGICRQALCEFGNILIMTAGDNAPVQKYMLSELLPHAFSADNLKEV